MSDRYSSLATFHYAHTRQGAAGGGVGVPEGSACGDLACWLGRFTVELSSYLLGSRYAQQAGIPACSTEVPMTTTPDAALVPVAPAFTEPERFALAGFLAS